MTIARYRPPGARPLMVAGKAVGRPIMRAGHMITFLVRALLGLPATLLHYKREFARVLSDVTWGNGSIVVGGGTAGVIIVLGATAGAVIGIEGYSTLDLLGMGPATGFISSFAATREMAPVMAALAFAAQAGCRFTAQLGAMRISEEIDAMESLAIRPIPYLVGTRLLASVVAVLPLYLVCLAMNYLACEVVVRLSGAASPGTY
ncbi:MlaE family ABC transporter permease, partial [Nocardia farcinica]|uniref:MlaE family ABC transporter permease n=3 Tax=Nocardia TaxID=1817 RepID=UPI002458C1BC